MNFKQDWPKTPLLSFIILGLSHLLLISCSLKIGYWDGIIQLINAEAICLKSGIFFCFRPLLISLINIPIVALKYLGVSPFTVLRLSHLFSFSLGILLIVAIYLFLRSSFPIGVALLTTLLFSLNSLFIHYAPFTMTDIPASLLYLLSIFLYLKVRRNGHLSSYACFILLVVAALLTRFNMILLPLTILLSEAILSFREKGSIKRAIKDKSFLRILFCLAISFGLFIVIYLFVLIFLLKGSFIESLRVILHNYLPSISSMPIRLLENLKTGFLNALAEHLSILIRSSGPGILVLSGLGCVVGLIRKRRNEDLVCLLWFLLFFFAMTFSFRHRESRYLLPLLFPLYYFCAHFFDLVLKLIVAYFKHKRLILILMSLLVMIQPMGHALTSHLHFRDPIYRTTFIEDINRIVQEAIQRDNKVYWWGKWFYPLFPSQHTFIEIDEGFYRYDFDPSILYFFSGVMRRYVREELPFLKKSSLSNHLFLESGDICLLNLYPAFAALRIRRIELILEERNNISYFRNEQMGDLFILQRKEGLKPIKAKIKGAELYLIRDDGIIMKGWTRFDQQESIPIKEDNNKKIRKIVLIVPLIEEVFSPMDNK